ncbi:zinc ABC transporter substrate-binding protein [Loktanella agnita]|uniref:zinc ABC transporter substrate-binding protein n=1 Tax=Loktanella agnita TaxID=287097 RepID=UPI003985F1DC
MRRSLALLSLLPSAALADVPRVITDIAPIHSLTTQVMGELGTPDLLLPPGADPHDFALRPSEAASLSKADLVIWVGHGLTPWLEEPLETLAPQASHLSLLESEAWDKLPIREAGHHDDDHDTHDDHDEDGDHDHEEAHDDHDGHADHDDHDHEDDHADHAEHGDGDHEEDQGDHDAHAHDHHDHGDFDPHAWLDPSIAQVWVEVIADNLASADPENADIYAQNAERAIADLQALEQELTTKLDGLSGNYILPHDGYQYFETHFGLEAQASIAGIDARDPGPAQVAALQDRMADEHITCVFSDAQIGARWATLVIEGTDARTAELDGVGNGLDAGAELYGQTLRRLGDAFADCLG